MLQALLLVCAAIAAEDAPPFAEDLTVIREKRSPQPAAVVLDPDDRSAPLCVAFSPDGKTLAANSDYQTIQLWDVATRKKLHEMKVATTYSWCVKFSPDGKTLASSGGGNTVKFWDVAGGKEIRTLKLGADYDFACSVAFSPDGKTLASGGARFSQFVSQPGPVDLWDAASGKHLRTLGTHADEVRSVVFSPDGKTLASAGLHDVVKLWDVASGRNTASFKPPEYADCVSSLAFAPDGKRLAAGCGDVGPGQLAIWDLASRKMTVRAWAGRAVLSVVFSPDGKSVVLGACSDSIQLHDAATGKNIAVFRTDGMAHSVAFSPDGKTLASAERHLTLWDLASAKVQDAPTGKKPDGKGAAERLLRDRKDE
jgi:WD40 repeat protein